MKSTARQGIACRKGEHDDKRTERGEKVPKLETFVRIANALEVSADLLLADVLQTQLFIDTSARAASINSLDKESRDRIYDVVDTLLRHEKKTK